MSCCSFRHRKLYAERSDLAVRIDIYISAALYTGNDSYGRQVILIFIAFIRELHGYLGIFGINNGQIFYTDIAYICINCGIRDLIFTGFAHISALCHHDFPAFKSL